MQKAVPQNATKSKILNLENAVLKRETDLQSISNSVIKIEGKRNRNR